MRKPETIMRKGLQNKIDLFRRQLKCRHKWGEHAYGFLCSKCEYYTGMHGILNDSIKRYCL